MLDASTRLDRHFCLIRLPIGMEEELSMPVGIFITSKDDVGIMIMNEFFGEKFVVV